MRLAPALLVAAALVACETEDAPSRGDEEIKVCGIARRPLADRTAGKTPLLDASELEVAADLPYPPGNVAAADDGRIFVSFFPDSNKGESKVAAIVNGKPVPYPDLAFQGSIRAVLGIRIDHQNRLWLLDHGQNGLSHAQLVAIDLATDAVVLRQELPRDVAPLGSLLNDLQISPDGRTVYISDASPVRAKHAIVVFDVASRTARRRLEDHPSVKSGKFDVIVDGERFKVAGVLCLELGVDGLALDRSGEQLHFAALSSGELFRVATRDLRDPSISDEALGARVVKVADVTMTDGMISDGAGNVYLTDMEHSAITRVKPDGTLDVLVKDARLRWPDGFSWTRDGDLLVTASALHQHVPDVVKTEESIARDAPYQLFRLRPQSACRAEERCDGAPGD
jgi:sugar lactone lactonase YvrE